MYCYKKVSFFFMQLIASQKTANYYIVLLTLTEVTCHFPHLSFLSILHVITVCPRWKFMRKKFNKY